MIAAISKDKYNKKTFIIKDADAAALPWIKIGDFYGNN